MPINAHPEYLTAEKQFYDSSTDEERRIALEEMIRFMPKHKSAEALRKNIRDRYKRLKEKIEKNKQKKGSSSKKSIRKADMQSILLGFTNTGKSSLLKTLTNAQPQIASYGFTTKEPEQGILNFQGSQIQILDLPPIGSEDLDLGTLNTTDTILLVIEKLNELPELQKILKNYKTKAKQILIFNKIDLQSENNKRKISETLKSKKHNFILTSTETQENINELKEKIFKSFNKIRVYSKQPHKQEHDNKPLILQPGSTIQDVVRKLLHSSTKIKKIRIWSPSSKFSGQIIGIKHKVKDKDIVEFTTE